MIASVRSATCGIRRTITLTGAVLAAAAVVVLTLGAVVLLVSSLPLSNEI